MAILTPGSAGYPVGLLFSQTSLTAACEQTQRQATLLAIEEINEAGGIQNIPLVAVEPSIGSNPINYRGAAERLFDEDKVRVFFGTHMSNTRKAVLPVVEAQRSLLFYPTMYEGFEYSPNCFYTGAAPNQNTVQLASHILSNYGRRVLFVGSNYIFARESNRIMRDLFEQSGGVVLDEIYLPLNTNDSDFDSVLKRASMMAPDAIYSTVVGQDTIKFYESFARSSLRNSTTPIASLATNETDLQSMSTEAAEGHISAAPYFQTLDSDENAKFVRRYHERFGDGLPITAGAEAAYFQVHLFAQAAIAAESLDWNSIVANLSESRFEAPQGTVRIDGATHHTYLWPRIAKVDAQRQFKIVHDEGSSARPEPYMIQHRIEDHAAQEA